MSSQVKRNDGMYWFPVNAAEMLSNISYRRCSAAAQSLYWNILLSMWANGENHCRIALDQKGFARNFGIQPGKISIYISELVSDPEPLLQIQDGYLYCEMLDKVQQNQIDKSEKLRNAANSRWNKCNANAMQKQCKSNAIRVDKSRVDKSREDCINTSTYSSGVPSEYVVKNEIFDSSIQDDQNSPKTIKAELLQAIKQWNEMAKPNGLPTVRESAIDEDKSYYQKWKIHRGGKYNGRTLVECFPEVLEQIPKSEFLLGRRAANNGRTYPARFLWLFQESPTYHVLNWKGLLDGNFTEKSGGTNDRQTSRNQNGGTSFAGFDCTSPGSGAGTHTGRIEKDYTPSERTLRELEKYKREHNFEEYFNDASETL